jgi:hypothetical protein
MAAKAPIYPQRIRRIGGSFSWIEHRFLHGGFLKALSPGELLLYYFLVTVADRNGVSYYSYERICALLKMTSDDYLKARTSLTLRGLIAFRNRIFQVLPLPQQCLPDSSRKPARPDSGPRRLAEIFKQLGER